MTGIKSGLGSGVGDIILSPCGVVASASSTAGTPGPSGTGWPSVPELWRERIEIVAIDPSAAFRKALRTYLPRAAVSVDKFHLVKLGNDMVTTVRQRLARTHRGRRVARTTRPGPTGCCCCAAATP